MYLQGLGNTLIIAFVAACIGITIGVIFAMIKYINKRNGKLKVLNAIANVYITIIRGTPVVLQLMILYFIVFVSWDNGIMIGAITFGLSALGLKVGNLFGTRFKNKAELAGGIILCLIGIEILLEHLGVISAIFG